MLSMLDRFSVTCKFSLFEFYLLAFRNWDAAYNSTKLENCEKYLRCVWNLHWTRGWSMWDQQSIQHLCWRKISTCHVEVSLWFWIGMYFWIAYHYYKLKKCLVRYFILQEIKFRNHNIKFLKNKTFTLVFDHHQYGKRKLIDLDPSVDMRSHPYSSLNS